jgi:hypothetical protein
VRMAVWVGELGGFVPKRSFGGAGCVPKCNLGTRECSGGL